MSAAPGTVDRFVGCFLGLALADALGAPLEGGPLERLMWRFVGTTREGAARFTDDTQMTLDLAESLVACRGLDREDAAARFAKSYHWTRGYGPGAAKLLRRIRAGKSWREANRSVFPSGSYGNGGAMRAAVVGLYYAGRPDEMGRAARESAEITHAHVLGMEGAAVIAGATAAALAGQGARDIVAAARAQGELPAFRERFVVAREWLEAGAEPAAGEVRARLGTAVTALDSCVTAIYLASRFLERPFSELVGFVASCGGDVDTVGAMSGAIWGAANGVAALPALELGRLEDRARVEATARALHEAATARA
jgi:poly(ADP-ribose) glycohydrolase ARH3